MDCINETAMARNSSQFADGDPSLASTTEYIKYYIMDLAMPFVCALGIVGNLLSLLVLTTEKLNKTLTKMEISAHIGLMALAVSDFLFCLLVLIFTQACLKDYYEVGDTLIYFDFLANGLITLFIITSTWLIVVMAAERYIAVCHPLRARKLISLRRTRASILLVFVVCALTTIPIFLEREIVEVTCDDGRKVYKLEERSQRSVKLRRILWAILFDFIPCAALVYFNLCLIVQIHKAKKLRDRMTPKHSIILYTSRGTKTSTQRLSPTKNAIFSGKSNGIYVQRMEFNQIRPSSSSSDATDNKGRSSYDTHKNGAREYGKFNGFSNYREKCSRSSWGPSTHSTDNNIMLAKDSRPVRRGENSSSAKKLSSGIKRRPSDSALNSVTATLVAVVLLFLILVSPSELLKFSVAYTQADDLQKQTVKYVTNFMQVLNFSLNFVLYCTINKAFRHTLHGLACCCWLSLRG